VRRYLKRIAAMDRAELAWRTSVAARTAAQRLQWRVSPPAWRLADIERVLAPGVSAETLAATILGRPARFVLDPGSTESMRAAIRSRWPDAAAEAAKRADQILRGEYDLLGYKALRFPSTALGTGNEIDWHVDPVHNRRAPRLFWADVPYLDPQSGDHKIIWELNRHQQWIALGRAFWLTGDTRYRDRIVHELRGWLAANPPLTGINWASMLEIGFRALSWTWALHAILGSGIGDRGSDPGSQIPDPWLTDLFVALDRQLTHLEQNLSYYFSPNTHLTGEALALYVAGSALPELAGSARWVETGRRILLTEIDRQILPDGGHAERSTHYQRYTLDFYTLAMLTAERTGDPAHSRFADAVSRLARFTRAMANDRGRLPLIGDDDGGMLWPMTGRECVDVRDSLALAATLLEQPELAPWGVPEEVFWLAGPARAAHGERLASNEHPRSCVLADTGFAVARGDDGSHAVLDCGAHGYMNAGHAHADALSVAMTWNQRPFLVDPGTSTYTMDPALRDRMRSSISHNTLTIDGTPPALPAGPFHWRTRADGRLILSRLNPGFDWIEAAHDGYAPLTHWRAIMRTTAGWFIVDEVQGSGDHRVDAHWHFDPAWMLTADAGALRATHLHGEVAWMLTDGGAADLMLGDEVTGLGWHAPVYGTLIPSWTARIRRDGLLPLSLITWIGTGSGGEGPTLERVTGETDTIAARVTAGQRVSTFALRPGGLADYQTDARVIHYSEEGTRFATLDLVDASHALAITPAGITVDADHTMADLHIAYDGTTLDIAASVPPASLRLQGGVVAVARHVRVNGRELPLTPHPGDGSLLLQAENWGRNAISLAQPQVGERFAQAPTRG
jgi:hypothetical protein